MFQSSYEELIYMRTYSRWLEKESRRENWEETIKRFENFFIKKVPDEKRFEFKKAIEAVKALEVLPSMRALWTAGPALERENIAAYNCAYLPLDNIRAFSEMLYILMCGTGVGFSVERQFTNQLPQIVEKIKVTDEILVIQDSKLGWAQGFESYLKGLWNGIEYKVDFSKLRPKGARLKTFGGRSSGPEPLKELFLFCKNLFHNAVGRKLHSIECHDVACKIASCVVVGGVRRSACISFSNLSDKRMSEAKTGEFWHENPQRMLSNNSVAYSEKPDSMTFIEEWLKLVKSKSGERGIFNIEAAKFTVQRTGRRKVDYNIRSNPCVTGDTLVTTDKGNIKIEDLVNNYKDFNILTYNIETENLEWEKILACEKTRENTEIIELELDDGEVLKLTPDHRVYTKNRGYIEAKNLTQDDIIITIE